MQLLCEFGGVQVRRQIDRSSAVVREHAHDWPLLSLFVLGGYRNTSEGGEVDIAGPSAVLYGAGVAHANRIGPDGFEQLEIQFDPRWLNLSGATLRRVRRWLGGPIAREVKALTRLCLEPSGEAALRHAVRGLIEAEAAPVPPCPAWIAHAEQLARADLTLTVAELSRRLGRHPAWVGASYVRYRGEELRAARARFRVEHAAKLLRETEVPQAQVAVDAGFCDQSHMIRVFRRVLGRSPSAVRSDHLSLRNAAADPRREESLPGQGAFPGRGANVS